MKATTIAEVIALLDEIIEQARLNHARHGFFAAMYRRMTANVQAGLDAGRFDRVDHVVALDVAFANRYFDAFVAWQNGGVHARTWDHVFAGTRQPGPLVIQHLLSGMNAHINFDLGIATAEAVPHTELVDFLPDFLVINELIAELVDDMQDRVNRLSPWFAVVDRVGGQVDEGVFNFSVVRARDWAWELAVELAALPRAAWPRRIDEVDDHILRLARVILRPGPVLRSAACIAGWAETRNVIAIIDALTHD